MASVTDDYTQEALPRCTHVLNIITVVLIVVWTSLSNPLIRIGAPKGMREDQNHREVPFTDQPSRKNPETTEN